MTNGFEKLRGVWKNAWLRAVVFTGLAVAALFLLAAGLAQLEFLPGLPLPMLLEQEAPPEGVGSLPGGDAILFILRVVGSLEPPSSESRRTSVPHAGQTTVPAAAKRRRRTSWISVAVPTVERAERAGAFCSIASAGRRWSILSTSGRSIRSRNWRA